jgi:hypothetical protein
MVSTTVTTVTTVRGEFLRPLSTGSCEREREEGGKKKKGGVSFVFSETPQKSPKALIKKLQFIISPPHLPTPSSSSRFPFFAGRFHRETRERRLR